MKSDHIFSIFGRFCPLPQVFGQVNDWSILEVHEMIRVLHMVACANVFIFFYGWDWNGRMFKFMKNDSFLNIFISFELFSQVFGQVNEWSILKLHGIIRVLHAVACPVVFALFDDPDWQERVLQIMKNEHFLVFLAVLVLLRKFLGR